MELYKKYPKLTTTLCFVEVFMYAGHLFGWSSLLFILKSEGFYMYLCAHEEYTFNAFEDVRANNSVVNYDILSSTGGANTSLTDTSKVLVVPHIRDYNATGTTFRAKQNITLSEVVPFKDRSSDSAHRPNATFSRGTMPGCPAQDAKLNLWFSVAIFAAYFACAFLGPLLQKTGVFLFRIILMCFFVFGALCLSLATPSLPWLICPGLCCVGIAGMAVYTTNIQTSFLFPTIQSTITSMFVGLYDASTIFTQLVKVAFELGISRKTSYIVFGVVYVLLLGCNTVFFMPRVRLDPNRRKREVKESGIIQDVKEREKLFFESPGTSPEKSLMGNLLSAQYLLHIYWMAVQGLRFVTFLGFLNSWLSSRFNADKERESYYLGVFSYTTLGTAVSAVTAGLLHDCQRRYFIGAADYKRKRLPIVLPLVITTLLAILTTALTFVTKEAILYVVFILFTIYRSYLFSFEVTFINDIFPMEYFSVLFGILHSSAGLSGMLQFPLFKWYQSYVTAPLHVNTFFIVLEVTTLLHPFYLWFKCYRHKDAPNEHSLNIDLTIVPETKSMVKPV